MRSRYDKSRIEQEATKSVERGAITEFLGAFILQRSWEIAKTKFYVGNNDELLQMLVDEGVMRCCEKFLHYYQPNGSAANLIISMIHSAMYNKIQSLNWRDQYGENIKGRLLVFQNGQWRTRLIKYQKDDSFFD